MVIGYIITAYNNCNQLFELIEQLNSENALFFVHFDKTKDSSEFYQILNLNKTSAKIYSLKREDSRWGRWGFTKAFLNGMDYISNNNLNVDFVVTMSGQDLPIKTNKEIMNFFENNKDKNFIEYFEFPYINWLNGGVDRIYKYHIFHKDKYFSVPTSSPIKSKIDKLIYFFLKQFFKLPRQVPQGLKIYGGSCWFAINRYTLDFIVNYVKNNKKVIDFFKYTYLPDEIFFQTIILNSQDFKITDNLINWSPTYVDWNKPLPPFPAVLTLEDYDILATSNKLFARKFSCGTDNVIIEKIKSTLL